MKRPRRTRTLRYALYSLAVAVGFFAAVEAAVRLWVPASKLEQHKINILLPKSVIFEPTDMASRVRDFRWLNAREPDLVVATEDPTARVLLTPAEAGPRRWYVLGSSAAFGLGLPVEERTAALLEKRILGLRAINAALVSASSDLILDHALKILDAYDPAGLIVYEGNNEFYTWYYPHAPRFLGIDVRPLVPWLTRSWTYRALASVRMGMRRFELMKPAPGRFYAERSVVDDGFCADYPKEFGPDRLDRATWEATRDRYLGHFAGNLAALVAEARAKGVPVVLCTSPVNPILSPCYWLPQPPSLDPAASREVLDLVRRGWERQRAKDYAGAERLFRDAVALDAHGALALYGEGLARLRMGDVAAAMPLLLDARENTLGYLSSMLSVNGRVRHVAAASGAALCDLERAYVARSLALGGPPGDALFMDYCHPTQTGNVVIADAMADAIRRLRADWTAARPAR